MKVGLATALLTLIDAFLFGGKVTLTRAFVKETRKPYTNVQSTRVYGPTGTSYFWSVRPY